MRRIFVIAFMFFAGTAIANPVIRGTWQGVIIQYNPDSSKVKMPCTFYINDDDDNGAITGEVLMTFTYKNGKDYLCKARFSGNVDLKTYDFSMIMEEYEYYDLLPEGMQWCLGSFYGSIRREMQLKAYIILATMKTKCNDATSDVYMVKQQ